MRIRKVMVTLILAGAMSPVLFAQATPAKAAHPAVNPLEIYISRARAQDAQGRHDLASANWRQVLLLSPRQAEALAALARYYHEAGDAANAKIYADRLRAIQPQHVELKANSSSADDKSILEQASRLGQEHRYREALDLYRKVLGENPTSGDWAVVYYQTEAAIPERQAHAVQSLRNIVSAYPANPNYALALAKVLTYNPATRAEGFHMLQQLHGSPQVTEEARAAWREALLWDPSNASAQESGAAYLARYPDGELEEKLRTGQQARVRSESDSTPEEAQAYRALQNGDLASATKQFSDLLKKPGQSARAHMGLGYVAMKQQDFDGAVEHLESAKNEGLRSSGLETSLHEARYWQLMKRANKQSDAGDTEAAGVALQQAIQVDPNRPEANEALAGLWVKKEQPEKAIAILRNVLQAHSDRESAWLTLVSAELQAGRFAQILAQQKNIPADVQEKLNHDPDYLASLASAQMSLGNEAEAQQILGRLNSIPAGADGSSVRLNLKLADLMLRQDRVEEAIRLSRKAVVADRSNPDAWRTLIRAEDQAGRYGSALQLVEHVPSAVKDKLMQDPGYLIQAASIYQKQHEYDGATLMLQRAQDIGAKDLQTSIPLQLQLASLDLEMGRTGRAYEIYRQLTREVPDRPEPWIGLLSAMHSGKHDAEALDTAQAMPSEIRFTLRKDTNYLQVLASIYTANGDDVRARECLKRVTQHYREQGTSVPFGVNLQYAWLQLNAGDEAGLSASLDSLTKAADGSPAHKKQVEDLWVAWSIRRAEAILQTGGADQAFKLLDAAAEVYPNNADLRHEMGTLYIRRGQPDNAYRLYERFEWAAATQADFAGGISAAAASNHWKQAEMWIHMGLTQYPGNRQLLTQAAQLEQDHGDLKKAEALWSSVRALDDPNSEPGTLASTGNRKAYPSATPAGQLATLLKPSSPASRSQVRERVDSDDADAELNDALFSGSPRIAGAESSSDISADLTDTSVRSAGDADVPVETTGHSGKPVIAPISTRAPKHAPSAVDIAAQMKGEAHAEDSNADAAAWSASSFKGENAARNTDVQVRLKQSSSFLARSAPISRDEAGESDLLDGASSSSATGMGDPDSAGQGIDGSLGSSNLHPVMMGVSRLPQKDDGLSSLQAQMSSWAGGGASVNSRSGSAGFDQLTRIESTVETSAVIGQSLRLTGIARPVLLQGGQASSTPLYAWGTSGTAPAGNQYASGVGGEVQVASAHVQASLGYSPASFAVQNTLGSLNIAPTRSFSFHFSRQPVKDTLLSYAGATDSKTGQVWGGVVATGGGVEVGHGDVKSGFYALFDYSSLTGRNVTSNTRVSGSMGGYWKGYQNDYGALTVGLNMTGLHYDKNLQYFTFGQGGYFSPDIYMLINAPVTWESKPMQNFTYKVTGSIGTQSYQQGAIVAGSLLTDTYSTPGASSNYSLDARGSYRITPNWYLEGFLSANNTYDYQQRLAGFSLKYMSRPHPAGETSMPTGLFDVEAIRPLLIP